MAKSAKVRVSIDTRKAKKDLKDVAREGAATSARVNSELNRGGGMGIGKGFGVGAALGAGASFGKSIVSGPIGDVFGEAIAPVKEFADRVLEAPDARAKRETREKSADLLATHAGQTNDTTAAQAVYKQALPFAQAKERGRAANKAAILAGDPTDTKEGDKIESATDTIINAINEGFQQLIDAVGVNGR